MKTGQRIHIEKAIREREVLIKDGKENREMGSERSLWQFWAVGEYNELRGEVLINSY